MSTKDVDDKEEYERSAQFRSPRLTSVCAPPPTSAASGVVVFGPSCGKVEGEGEDVVGYAPIQRTLKLPDPGPPGTRTPYDVYTPLSLLTLGEDEIPSNEHRFSSAFNTTRLPATRYSSQSTAYTTLPPDTTPSVQVTSHVYRRPSFTPTGATATPANTTSVVHTTPSACVFSTVHADPLLCGIGLPSPVHACQSSPQVGGVGGDRERDPMVGLLYDQLPPFSKHQGVSNLELPQPATKGSPVPGTSPCILKAVATPPTPPRPPPPPPPPPPTPPLPPFASTAYSPTGSEKPYPETNRDTEICPEKNKGDTWRATLGKEDDKGDTGKGGRHETRISTTGKEPPPSHPSGSKFTSTPVVTTDSITGNTKTLSVVSSGATPKDVPGGAPGEDVKVLIRKLRLAEEKIRAMEAEMEQQALQIEGLQGIYESKSRENKQLKRRIREQCLHMPPTSTAMPPATTNYELGGNTFCEINPENVVNSGVRNIYYSELDPALNSYYGCESSSSSGALPSYSDLKYGNDYEHSRLGHGQIASSDHPEVDSMPNTVDALKERLSALHLQNTRLSSSLKEEKMKRSEMEDVIKRERSYIKRLEDSLQEMSKTRVVMDPSTYQQVAQAYIASRRPTSRRKHGDSTYPGHLVCDRASSTQQGSL